MKSSIAILCFLLGAACSGETTRDDDAVSGIDAAVSEADAASPDAVVETCQTASPPDARYGRCGAPNSCNPPLCWQCAGGAAGPTWTVVGDDGCNPTTCAPARESWRHDLAGLDRSCTVDADCTLVGGLTMTCAARPTVANHCGGDPVRASALAATNLSARAATWTAACEHQSCGTLGCIVDCAPGIPRCVAGQCTVEERSCLPIPPDAGM